MTELTRITKGLIRFADDTDNRRMPEVAREFIEQLTFAMADEIIAMLEEVLEEDWMALPPWARNLAYRLACLQRPADSKLLRGATADLLSFGPDWDDQAERLRRQADQAELGGTGTV